MWAHADLKPPAGRGLGARNYTCEPASRPVFQSRREGAIISPVDTILIARNPVEERPRRRHERDPRETAGRALGGDSATPDIVAGSLRHRRPWPVGLRLGGCPGGRPP